VSALPTELSTTNYHGIITWWQNLEKSKSGLITPKRTFKLFSFFGFVEIFCLGVICCHFIVLE
jgi:hypothetical protein